MDENNVEWGSERIIAGLFGLVLVGFMVVRLWRWFSGVDFQNTVWGAIAGRPIIVNRWACWDYGLWELFPDGQLAAGATIVCVVALIAGSLLNWRRLYFMAGGVVFGGYMVNAYLMVKLMAAY